MKSKSSPSKKKVAAAAKEPEAHDPSKMQLQIMEPSSFSPMFRSPPKLKLPPGWVVEKRPRANSASHRVDMYYYEPKSGRQFRSLTAVQKHLCEEMESNATTQRLKSGDENSMQIVPHVFSGATTFKLPPGWIVDEKPRSNVRYAGVIDRYYIEPGTSKRFRSMRAVERYLAGMETSAAASEVPKPSSTSASLKKQKSAVEVDPLLDFTSPPARVKWVLGGRGGNPWTPFMGESMVPESAQQTWSKTFILSIQDEF